jgi:hypothetical protein
VEEDEPARGWLGHRAPAVAAAGRSWAGAARGGSVSNGRGRGGPRTEKEHGRSSAQGGREGAARQGCSHAGEICDGEEG